MSWFGDFSPRNRAGQGLSPEAKALSYVASGLFGEGIWDCEDLVSTDEEGGQNEEQRENPEKEIPPFSDVLDSGSEDEKDEEFPSFLDGLDSGSGMKTDSHHS